MPVLGGVAVDLGGIAELAKLNDRSGGEAPPLLDNSNKSPSPVKIPTLTGKLKMV